MAVEGEAARVVDVVDAAGAGVGEPVVKSTEDSVSVQNVAAGGVLGGDVKNGGSENE